MTSSIDEAVAALSRGLPVVIPTDTVYGIAARPDVAGAIDALFALKGRDRSKALPVLGASLDQLAAVVEVNDRALLLAERFWPGPLTLVLPRTSTWGHDVGGDGPTIGVRVPAHPTALELLARTGPLAVTSANRSGEPEAKTATEAVSALGHGVAAVLDGGTCDGKPSTVISLVDQATVLRRGSLSDEILQTLTS